MRRLVFTALTALLMTSGAVAGAQLPGGGTHMGIGRSPGRDDPAMKEIGAALELRLANGVNIIIAHAKDLSLTSEQLGRVAVINPRRMSQRYSSTSDSSPPCAVTGGAAAWPSRIAGVDISEGGDDGVYPQAQEVCSSTLKAASALKAVPNGARDLSRQ